MPVHLLATTSEEWTTVVGAAFLATVAGPRAGSADDAIAAIARLAADPNVSLEAVVSAIPVGADGVEAFAIVHLDDAAALAGTGSAARGGIAVTAVVRGRAVIDVYSVGGSRRFSSSGVQPWLMAGFRDVIALELGGPERGTVAVPRRGAEASVHHTGVRYAGGVQWLLTPSDTLRGSEGGGSGAPEPRGEVDDATVHLFRSSRVGLEHGDEDENEDHDTTFDDTIHVRRRRIEALERTTLRPTTVRRPSEADGSAAALPSVAAASPAVTATSPSAPAEPTTVAAELTTVAAEPTTVTATSSVVAPAPPAVAPAPPAVAPAPPAVVPIATARERELWVHLPDGVVIPLETRSLIIGRRPVARARSDQGAALVAVPSPHRVVSASHLRIERSGDVVVITDLRSRNGTAVTPDGGVRRRLRPGESIVVSSAAVVDVGDGMIIEITAV